MSDESNGLSSSWPRVVRRERIALAVVLCAAAALRLVDAGESLWLDELHTAWTVADGAGAIVPRAVIGNQSPVYFFFVWLTVTAGGLHEWTLRLPSLLAGVGLAAGGWWAVRRWTGSGVAGLLTAALVAVNRDCIFYSQEARTYALVQLVGLFQVAVFRRLMQQPTPSLRGAFLATTLGLYYLHYTSLLLLVAELAAWAGLWIVRPWRPAYRPRPMAVDLTILAAGLAPSWPQIMDIAARREAWAMFVLKQPFGDIFTLLPLTTCVVVPAAIGGGAWLAHWLMRWRRWSPLAGLDPRTVVLVAGWLFVPLILAWLATERDWARLFLLRYVIVSLLAPLVLAGFVVAACPDRWSRCLCAVVVTATTVWDSGMIEQWRFDGRLLGDRNQDWRGAVAFLNGRLADPRTPVFVRSGLIEADRLPFSDDPRLREFCLLPVRGLYRLHQEDTALIPLPTSDPGLLSPAERHRIHAAGEAWFLLLARPDAVEWIADDIIRSCASKGTQAARLAERLDFGEVAVLHVESRPTPAGSRGGRRAGVD